MKTPDQRIRPGFWLGLVLLALVAVIVATLVKDVQQKPAMPVDAASAVEIPMTGDVVVAAMAPPFVTNVQVRLNVSSKIGAFPRMEPREHASASAGQ